MDLITLFDTIHESYYTFQLLFSFIYNIFSKKISVSAK